MVLTAVTNIITSIFGSLAKIIPSIVMAFKPPDGIAILYLKFCLYSSIFITLFLLGGLVTPFVGIVYMYTVFYKKIKCYNNNIPDSKCLI